MEMIWYILINIFIYIDYFKQNDNSRENFPFGLKYSEWNYNFLKEKNVSVEILQKYFVRNVSAIFHYSLFV